MSADDHLRATAKAGRAIADDEAPWFLIAVSIAGAIACVIVIVDSFRRLGRI